MKSVPSFLIGVLCMLVLTPVNASQEHVSALEELSKDAARLILVGSVKGRRKPPQTTDWEYDVEVREVLLGELKSGNVVAVVHYRGRPGISVKTQRSGVEDRMRVGGQYVFLFNSGIDPSSHRGYLMRAEELTEREAVIKKFVRQ